MTGLLNHLTIHCSFVLADLLFTSWADCHMTSTYLSFATPALVSLSIGLLLLLDCSHRCVAWYHNFVTYRLKQASNSNQIIFKIPWRGRAVDISPTTANIPLPTPSKRTPLSIPLQSLRSQFRVTSGEHTRVLESTSEKCSRRSSFSSTHSAQSDFSLWTDTGDLAEQLADIEDPLQGCSRESFNQGFLGYAKGGVRVKQLKSVHFSRTHPENQPIEPGKESVDIPLPVPRRVSRLERFLAGIMSPNNRQTAQVHGFVGKPLLWVFLFVSQFYVTLDSNLSIGTLQAFLYHWVSSCSAMIKVLCLGL